MSQTTPCRTCGASLAPDQRYCVGCGTRAAAPRLDFLAEAERAEAAARTAGAGASGAAPAGAASGTAAAGAASGVAAAPGAAAASPSRLDRIGGPMGVAAIALVSLGVGFLLGQTRAATPPAQRAPVVKIENTTPSGGDAATAGEQPAGEATPSEEQPAAEETAVPQRDRPATETPPAGDAAADDGAETETNG